ncbi:MAG: YceI family protein [Candidatus Phaeomarinobacter sp.]
MIRFNRWAGAMAVVGTCWLLVAGLALPLPAHEGHDHSPDASMMPGADLPAGDYHLDLTHASLILGVDHLGLSTYRARFTRMDATLAIDPAEPDAAALSVTVDAASLETQFPLPQPDFNATLTGPEWLNAEQYPDIRYVSTTITMTSPKTAEVTGDLTLMGVTRPVVLDVTFNGGYGDKPFGDLEAVIGFSATGAFNRSAFGLTNGLPPEGTSMGVGDRVEVLIEAEFHLPVSAAP